MGDHSGTSRAAATTTAGLGLETTSGDTEHDSAAEDANLARLVNGDFFAVGVNVECVQAVIGVRWRWGNREGRRSQGSIVVLDRERAKDDLEVNIRLGAIIRVGRRGGGCGGHGKHRVDRLGGGARGSARVGVEPGDNAGKGSRLLLLGGWRGELIEERWSNGRRGRRRKGPECPVVNHKLRLDGCRHSPSGPALCTNSLKQQFRPEGTAHLDLARVDTQFDFLVLGHLAVAPDKRRAPAAPQEAHVLAGGLENTWWAAGRDEEGARERALPRLQDIPCGLVVGGKVDHEADVEGIDDAVLDMGGHKGVEQERNGVVECGSQLERRHGGDWQRVRLLVAGIGAGASGATTLTHRFFWLCPQQ